MKRLDFKCLFFCFVTFSTSVATKCFTDAECENKDEYCFLRDEPVIQHIRQLLIPPGPRQGDCEKYKVRGDLCSPFEISNGHSSCAPGLTCQLIPISSAGIVIRSFYLPGPGYYRCEQFEDLQNSLWIVGMLQQIVRSVRKISRKALTSLYSYHHSFGYHFDNDVFMLRNTSKRLIHSNNIGEMKTMLLKLLLLGALLSTTEAVTCFTDAECGVGECCYRQTGPLIVSKRQKLDTLFSGSRGACKKYLLEGQHCNVFDQWNYHCSCAPGLQCDYKLPSTTTSSPSQLMRAGRTLPVSPELYRCMPRK